MEEEAKNLFQLKLWTIALQENREVRENVRYLLYSTKLLYYNSPCHIWMNYA
jgi:hypothetical protein